MDELFTHEDDDADDEFLCACEHGYQDHELIHWSGVRGPCMECTRCSGFREW